MQTGDYSEELGCLQLYFVEMGKFHKGWSELRTLLERWVAFLLWAQELDRENLPETVRADTALTKAFGELERMSADPAMRDAYAAEEKARMMDAATLEYAKQKAEERGLQQGLARGLQQGLARGLEQGLERGIARGLEQGLERGLVQGTQQGRLQLLVRQLTRHIGEVPPNIMARLGALTTAQLDDLGVALFDLNS